MRSTIYSKQPTCKLITTHLFFLIINLSIFSSGFAQSFITTWKTNNSGTSNSTSITIPTTGGGYNYDVDWNDDGVFDQFGITGNVTHDFGVAGTYTIRIQGAFPRIYFNGVNGGGDNRKILSVDQWGNIAWTSMERAFSGASNLTIFAGDSPDLSGVTNMSEMFYFAWNFTGDLSTWDVSSVTNMSEMFYFAENFTSDLSTWDVSSVTNMSEMFYFAENFTSDLSAWDVSSVTNMSSMFHEADNFTSDLSL
jgi:surface protein